jgi:serine/threonine protein kinase
LIVANADRIIELFHEAKSRPAGAVRDRFLAEVCGDDSTLKEQIDSLLKADADDGDSDFLKQIPLLRPVAPVSEKPGDRIGRYKLLEQIGEGGCGVVYMAEQEEPVRRRVALKVIKLGMDTKQVIARFEAERQALAMMDHPNIAKVLDGGATDTGRPFFVMELVRGIKITDYCDQNNLSTNERLELFIQVCQAVQHAHQKGIIHRDIKPSNILVTQHDDVAVPKVIDFGIAKATTGQLTDKTLFTAFAQFIGTPAYMSPEQAQMSGLDVDTRADIYSLGVLLYELLTGNTPFDAKELLAAGLDEMRRKIREDEPAKPSTCLSTMHLLDLTTVAGRRHVEPPKLIHLLRGDLDWLVMKCLEKDRTRRYETANGLAMDLERYLDNEPVLACPPSNFYRFQKLVHRHKVVFVAASAVTAALVLGLGISTCLFFKEKQTRQRAVAAEMVANTEAIKSGQVAKFLQDTLKGVGPSVALGRDTTMLRDILNQTAGRLEDLKAQPAVEADLRATLGNVYSDLGEFAIAESMLRKALSLRKQFLGDVHADVASSLNDLAEVLRKQTKFPEAETMHREALAMRRKLFDNAHPDVLASLDNLAETLSRQLQAAKSAEAEPMLFEVLAARRKQFGYESREVARSLYNLGLLRLRQGRPADGELLHREALAIRRKLFPNGHPEVADSLYYVGASLYRQRKLAGADPLLREALAMRRRVLGEEHPDVGMSLYQLAASRMRQNDLTEAEDLYRRALAMQRKLLLEADPNLSDTMGGLANCLALQHAYPEAENLRRELLAMYRKRMTATTRFATGPLTQLAELLQVQGKIAEVESLYREELTLRRGLYGNNDPNVATLLDLLAGVLSEERKLTEAEAIRRESLRIRQQTLPQGDWQIANARSLLGDSLLRQKKYAEAEPLLLSGYEGMKQREEIIPARQKSVLRESIQRLVQLYDATSQSETAAEWNKKLAELDKTEAAKKTAPPNP